VLSELWKLKYKARVVVVLPEIATQKSRNSFTSKAIETFPDWILSSTISDVTQFLKKLKKIE
jgi:hypothetical protein